MEILIYHYTNKRGWNAIRSQVVWAFRASRPPAAHRPFGVYFTDVKPTRESLSMMYEKLMIPKRKQEFVFQFKGSDGLCHLNNGRGRDRRIYYAPTDYSVEAERQTFEGPTAHLLED